MKTTITTVFIPGTEEDHKEFKHFFLHQMEEAKRYITSPIFDCPYVIKDVNTGKIEEAGCCTTRSSRHRSAELVVKVYSYNLAFVKKDIERMLQITNKDNKSTPKPSANFKIGDWVVVDNVDPKWPNHRTAIGHIFPIRNDIDINMENFNKGTHRSPVDPENRYSINYHVSNIRPATEEEIRDHLCKEAQERGLTIGTKIKDSSNIQEVGYITEQPRLVMFDTWSLHSGNQFIYHNGKWATIVEEKEPPKFFGHEVVWDSDYEVINVGCKEFSKGEFYDMFDFMDTLAEHLNSELTIDTVFNEIDKVKDWVDEL